MKFSFSLSDSVTGSVVSSAENTLAGVLDPGFYGVNLAIDTGDGRVTTITQDLVIPPLGFVYLTDQDGSYLLDSNGSYLIEAA